MILSGPQRTMKMGASSDIFWAAAGERRSIHSGAVEPVYEYGLDALEAQRTVALAQKAGSTRRNLSILCGVLRFAARRRRRCKSFIPAAAVWMCTRRALPPACCGSKHEARSVTRSVYSERSREIC